MSGKVSIIVPVYNAAEHLEECLQSIANQTYKDKEIIIIDDGSTDLSREICDVFAAKCSVAHVYHISNSGVSFARNMGIGLSEGKYITFIDSDDVVAEDYISKLVSAIKKTNADYVICAFDCFSMEGKERHINYLKNNGDIIDVKQFLSIQSSYQAGAFWGANWAKLYIKEIIRKNQIKFRKFNCFAEDYKFNLEYLQHVDNIAIVHDSLYKYRENTEGSLSKKQKDPAIFWNDYMELYEYYCILYKIKHSYKENKKKLDKFLLNACKAVSITLINNEQYKTNKKILLIRDMIKYVTERQLALSSYIKSPSSLLFMTRNAGLYYLLLYAVQKIKEFLFHK